MFFPKSQFKMIIKDQLMGNFHISGTRTHQGRVEAEVHHVAVETEPDRQGLTRLLQRVRNLFLQGDLEIDMFPDYLTRIITYSYHCISDFKIG